MSIAQKKEYGYFEFTLTTSEPKKFTYEIPFMCIQYDNDIILYVHDIISEIIIKNII